MLWVLVPTKVGLESIFNNNLLYLYLLIFKFEESALRLNIPFIFLMPNSLNIVASVLVCTIMGSKHDKTCFANSFTIFHFLKEDSDIFDLCKSDTVLFQGEAIKSNMKKGPMRRLRYNPLWESMIKTIKLFIKKRIINNI